MLNKQIPAVININEGRTARCIIAMAVSPGRDFLIDVSSRTEDIPLPL